MLLKKSSHFLLGPRAVGKSTLIKAYQNYSWNFNSINDIKIAPFHILASEGHVYNKKTHLWHMEVVKKCAEYSNALIASSYKVVDLENEHSIQETTEWWQELTENGGEGMVIKPMDFTVERKNGPIQPAIKCRGRNYLRIIYGPEYTAKHHIQTLKKRTLGKKRSMALREFVLGIESLERFINREPLRKIHECVYGVMAMENEPVDPRL